MKIALLSFVAKKALPKASILMLKGIHGSRKERLAGDTTREENTDEVKELRREARDLT